MFNVTLNKVNPFVVGLPTPKQELKTLPAKISTNPSFASYTSEHVKANFLPSLAFTGVHKDAVIGIETKIVGISNYQKEADAVKFRFLHREQRGEKEKIQLELRREPDNSKDKNAIAVYHVYKGKSGKLGHIPASMAKNVAPLMDKGYKFEAGVVNVGGKFIGHKSPYTGIRIRLEYVTSPDRSPNLKKVKTVKKAFKNCLQNGSALKYREELIYNSKELDGAAKMRVDTERSEVTIYRKG